MTGPSLVWPRIRLASESDQSEILSLLSLTLGWQEDDRHRRLLAWKHQWNPFGLSPMWVAEDEKGVIGFRALMRWEFICGGQTIRTVRAVDTATHPRAQGRGVFKALTLRAVEDMAKEGVSWVFNTPNSQSAPGYLSMGWQSLGRLPLSFRPSSLRVLPKLPAATGPGDLWSSPTTVGDPAASLLADTAAVDDLLERSSSDQKKMPSLWTRRTSAFLMWRYGLCPVGYHGVPVGRRISSGIILFRVRRRGGATELVIGDLVVPRSTAGSPKRAALRKLLRASGADYAVALGQCRPPTWLPLPRRGPLLTWRRLAWQGSVPKIDEYGFSTGDIELF